MAPEGIVATAPLVGLTVNVLIHVGISLLAQPVGFLAGAALGILGGAVTTLVLIVFGLVQQSGGTSDAVFLLLLGGLTYTALGFGYFNFVNLNVTSLRIRLLRELLERYPAGLTRHDIVRQYGAETVIRLRLERLVRGGHVSAIDGRYFMRRRSVLVIAGVFSLLKRIVIPSRLR